MTVTVYVPATVPVHDSVEVPEPPVMVPGVNVHVRPVAGEMLVVSVTVPVNPLSGVIVIVEVAAVPTFALTLVGLAEIMKSGTTTLTVTVVECDRLPLVPVTVIV